MYNIKLLTLQVVGKIMKMFSKGSSIVGYLDTKFKFDILKEVDFTDKEVIFVIGTNGKTSIVNSLYSIYEAENKHIASNLEGANLINGMKTAIIMNLKKKKLNADVLLLEVDERSLKHIIKLVKPNHTIITNFFRDQLDRYFEISLIIEEVVESLKETNSKIYYNGQDALLESYFGDIGLENIKYEINKTPDSFLTQENIVEIKYCPKCEQLLEYGFYHYAHIGSFFCTNCDFAVNNIKYSFNISNKEILIDQEKITFDNEQPLYVLINYSLLISFSLENNIPLQTIFKVLAQDKRVKGRNNIIKYKGKDVYLNLVKNVVGLEQTILTLKKEDKIDLLFCFNDNHADGKDVSWIWDVNIDDLIPHIKTLHVVGTRKEEIKLRFLYNGFDEGKIKDADTIKEAIDNVIKEDNPKIITNYTPLSEINNVLLAKENNE